MADKMNLIKNMAEKDLEKQEKIEEKSEKEEQILNNYLVQELLGEGTYSKVYKAKDIKTDQTYAMKKIEIYKFEGRELQNILNEIRILSSIQHPNIIEYKESFIDFETQTLCIVTEYADYGDLYDCINWFKESEKEVNERDIWVILFQVLRGLKTQHDNKIIHRDLKSANIFLFSNGSVKIGDMNVSAFVGKTDNQATTQTGTPYYSSPEIWDEVPYSYQSDMWSLGCLAYEMAAQRVPFDGDSVQALMKVICKGEYDAIPEKYSIEIASLIQLLLNIDPAKRPTCESILEYDFVKDIEKYLVEQSELPIYDKGQLRNGLKKRDYSDLGKTLKFETLEKLNEELLKSPYYNKEKTEPPDEAVFDLSKSKQNTTELSEKNITKDTQFGHLRKSTNKTWTDFQGEITQDIPIIEIEGLNSKIEEVNRKIENSNSTYDDDIINKIAYGESISINTKAIDEKGNQTVALSQGNNHNLTNYTSDTEKLNTNKFSNNQSVLNSSDYEFDLSAYSVREKIDGSIIDAFKKKLDIQTNDPLLINEKGQVNIKSENKIIVPIEANFLKDQLKLTSSKEILQIMNKEQEKATNDKTQTSTSIEKQNNKPNFKIKEPKKSAKEIQINNIENKRNNSKQKQIPSEEETYLNLKMIRTEIKKIIKKQTNVIKDYPELKNDKNSRCASKHSSIRRNSFKKNKKPLNIKTRENSLVKPNEASVSRIESREENFENLKKRVYRRTKEQPQSQKPSVNRIDTTSKYSRSKEPINKRTIKVNRLQTESDSPVVKCYGGVKNIDSHNSRKKSSKNQVYKSLQFQNIRYMNSTLNSSIKNINCANEHNTSLSINRRRNGNDPSYLSADKKIVSDNSKRLSYGNNTLKKTYNNVRINSRNIINSNLNDSHISTGLNSNVNSNRTQNSLQMVLEPSVRNYSIKKSAKAVDLSKFNTNVKNDTSLKKASVSSKPQEKSIQNVARINILNNGYLALALNQGKDTEIETNTAKKCTNPNNIATPDVSALIMNSSSKKQQNFDNSCQSGDLISNTNKNKFTINKSKERKLVSRNERSLNTSSKPKRETVVKSINQLEEIYNRKKDSVRGDSNDSKNYKILKKKSINIDTKAFCLNKNNLTKPLRKSIDQDISSFNDSASKNVGNKKLKIPINFSKIHNSLQKQINKQVKQYQQHFQ